MSIRKSNRDFPDYYTRYTLSQRILLILISVLCFTIIFNLIVWPSNNYKSVYINGENRSIKQIQAILTYADIDSKVIDNSLEVDVRSFVYAKKILQQLNLFSDTNQSILPDSSKKLDERYKSKKLIEENLELKIRKRLGAFIGDTRFIVYTALEEKTADSRSANRLNITILLDNKLLETPNTRKQIFSNNRAKWGTEELEELLVLVTSSLELNLSKEDGLTIKNLQLNLDSDESILNSKNIDIIRFPLIVIIILIFFFTILMPILRGIRSTRGRDISEDLANKIDFLEKIDSQNLLKALESERGDVMVVVINSLSRQKAGEIINSLSKDQKKKMRAFSSKKYTVKQIEIILNSFYYLVANLGYRDSDELLGR